VVGTGGILRFSSMQGHSSVGHPPPCRITSAPGFSSVGHPRVATLVDLIHGGVAATGALHGASMHGQPLSEYREVHGLPVPDASPIVQEIVRPLRTTHGSTTADVFGLVQNTVRPLRTTVPVTTAPALSENWERAPHDTSVPSSPSVSPAKRAGRSGAPPPPARGTGGAAARRQRSMDERRELGAGSIGRLYHETVSRARGLLREETESHDFRGQSRDARDNSPRRSASRSSSVASSASVPPSSQRDEVHKPKSRSTSRRRRTSQKPYEKLASQPLKFEEDHSPLRQLSAANNDALHMAHGLPSTIQRVCSIGSSSGMPCVVASSNSWPNAKIATTEDPAFVTHDQGDGRTHSRSPGRTTPDPPDIQRGLPWDPTTGASVGSQDVRYEWQQGEWVPILKRQRSSDVRLNGVRRATTPEKHPEPAAQESSKGSSTAKQESSPRKRSEMLYMDNEMRQRRWLARFEEQRRREEDEHLQLEVPRGNRKFDESSFKNWYATNTNKYFEAEQDRRQKQQSKERVRVSEERAACRQFSTQASSAPKGKSTRQGGSGPSSPSSRPKEEKVLADELIAAQLAERDALRKLDEKEKEQRAAHEVEAEEELRLALEDNRKCLENLFSTPEGQEMMGERMRGYMSLNAGMDEVSAALEARHDFAVASEEKVRSDAAVILRRRAHSDTQRVQLARLQVVRELIHLQKRHEELVASHGVAQSLLQSFDSDLVNRIKQEAWYCEARDAAERIIRAEAEMAAESAAAENARNKKFAEARNRCLPTEASQATVFRV